MTQTTEAACLLQSGSAYAKRLGFRTEVGQDLFIGMKPGGVSIYFGDAPIYHFDPDGRWQRAFIDGVHYLKGLDATVRSVNRDRVGINMVLRNETLDFARTTDLDAEVRSVALDLIDLLESDTLTPISPPSSAQAWNRDELRTFLDRVAGWDSASWFSHRERYLSTYGTWPFLPPDCPNSVVLQATLGHKAGSVFGRGPAVKPYFRSVEEFEEHAQAVSKLLGKRLAQCRGVFLGGADFLHSPIDEVLAILMLAGRIFMDQPDAARSESIHAILDDLEDPMPDLEGWQRLQAARLGRVTIGIASGDREIRGSLGQPWENSTLIDSVSAIKAAGIGVGLVILVGQGDKTKAADHLDSTTELVGSLPLTRSDLVTLLERRNSDFRESTTPDELSPSEVIEQVAEFKRRLSARSGSNGPRVVLYNPDKQGS